MRGLWQWLGFALAAVAAVFGASWAKRKIEARGAKRQHDLQEREADRVEGELAASDLVIDADVSDRIAEIRDRQAARHRDQDETDKRDPTRADVDEFMNGPED